MKEIKYLRLFAVLVLLFVLHNNLRADEKQLIQFTPAKTKVEQAKPKQSPEEKSKAVEQSKEISQVKQETQAKPKQVVEEKPKQAERLKEITQVQVKQETQTELKQAAEEKAKQQERLKEIARDKEIKQAQIKAREEELARKREEHLKEIARAKEEKQAMFKQIAEEKAKKEEQKRLEAEAGLKEKEQELALKEAQLKARQEELTRQKAERLEELAWAREQREAQLRARQEEKLKLEAERKAQEAQLRARQEKEAKEKRLKLEEERKAHEEELARQREEKSEELARQREERLKEIARAKEIKEAQLKARQEELTRQKEEHLKEIAQAKEIKEAQLKAQREKEAAEKQLKLEAERKASEEKLAREKEERLKEIARAKAEREAQLRARQEEKLKLEAERQAKEIKQAQLKAQREKEAAEKQLKLDEERRAREEELARQREEELEEEAQQQEERLEELAWAREQREAEFRVRQEELARQREERLEELAWAREEKEAEFRVRQEELAQEREERLEELAWAREEKEAELRSRQEELAWLETERQIQEAELQTRSEEEKQAGFRARQEDLAEQREEAKAKINEAKRASTQEKIITEAMLKKQQEDQAKIEKIEKLWKRARKLYDQEKYEEAIQDFQKIIDLEGNPRIKYTPEAKQYIEKAKINMTQKKGAALSKKVELTEGEMVNEVLKQQVPPYIEPPQRIEQREPTPLIEPPEIRKKLKATKITMDFDKVGLKSVIVFLAQESGVNFVASQKVLELTPVVSARFKDTALDEVIKYITKNIGLIYRIDKEVVWIAHPDEIANEPMETRVYYLNKGGGLFTEFSPMSAGTTETGLGGSSAQINKVYTIEDTLKEVVPWPSESKLSYDKRLNALIVRNTPGNLQMLEDMLYSLDVEPLQVLIEARFLEVDITDTKELGLEWKLTSGDWQLKDRNGTFKKGIGKDSGVDFSAFTRVTEGLNLTYKGMLTNSQFQAVLHALEESKKIKTLSSPRITTLNNQQATIKVVDEWIYPTRYEYEIVQFDLNGDGDFNDAGETTYKNVPKDFLRRDVGILLKVIPAVGADKKTISLSLIPEVSEGTADGFTYTGDVKLPKFTSRNLSTTVVVNSGDTVVLGGLIKESRTKTLTKVPFLGDIPIIGVFFKKDTDSIQRKNLLIFVTAKVLSASGEEVIVAQK